MMEIRLKLTFLENLFLCLCLLTGLGQANGSAVVRVREGSEAVLPCFIKPEKNIERDAFEWRKDRQMVFLYKNGNHSNNGLPGQDKEFKGRVSHFPDQLQFSDASIRIRDTKWSDRGNYICDFSPDDHDRKRFYIDLVVDACPKPSLTTLEVTNRWAILQCEVQGVSSKPTVQWRDSAGNNLTAEETLVPKTGSNNDIILETTVTKTDKYRCVVTQEEICHQLFREISVTIPGAEPSKGLPIGWIAFGVLAALVLIGLVVKYIRPNLWRCSGQDPPQTTRATEENTTAPLNG